MGTTALGRSLYEIDCPRFYNQLHQCRGCIRGRRSVERDAAGEDGAKEQGEVRRCDARGDENVNRCRGAVNQSPYALQVPEMERTWERKWKWERDGNGKKSGSEVRVKSRAAEARGGHARRGAGR